MADELTSLAASPSTGNSYHSSPVSTLLACKEDHPHCVVQSLRNASELKWDQPIVIYTYTPSYHCLRPRSFVIVPRNILDIVVHMTMCNSHSAPLSPPPPTNLSAVIVRKTERKSLPPSTAGTKRKAQEFGRLDSRSFTKRVRRSTRGVVDIAPAPTDIQRSVLPGASIDHGGNALTQNKQK